MDYLWIIDLNGHMSIHTSVSFQDGQLTKELMIVKRNI